MEASVDLIAFLKSRRAHLNPALQRITDFIIEHPEESKNITTKELAEQCQVAESTVTRFVKEIGFSSFRELKIRLAETLITSSVQESSEDEVIFDHISKEDDTETLIKKIIFHNTQRMKETEYLMNIDDINTAVAAIQAADTLHFASTGSSSVATIEAVVRFTRAGKKCVFWNDYSMQIMDAASASKNDLFIGISDTGRTSSVVDNLKLAKQNGAKTLALTSDPKSPLAVAADIMLLTPQRGDNNWESMTSKISQLLLIDILYVSYATSTYDESIQALNRTKESLSHTRY